MASPSSIISVGIGSWGSIADIVRLGYGLSVAAVGNPPPSVRVFDVRAEARRIAIAAEDRFYNVRAENRRLIGGDDA